MKLVSPLILLLAVGSTALAGPRENAYKIYNRLAGVPPTKTQLDSLEDKMKTKDGAKEVAREAMNTETFYSVFLMNMVSPLSNEGRVSDIPLNDFSATVMGYIKDDKPFNGILTDDVVYTHPGSAQQYNLESNAHYESVTSQGLDLRQLTPIAQSTAHTLREQAGLLTTRQFASEYYNMGTNRSPVANTLDLFLCYEINEASDNTRPDLYVRQDVPRAPGGDPNVFNTTCSGCHAGMDPLSKAFAYVDWIDGQNGNGNFIMNAISTGTSNNVQPKITRNSANAISGYRIKDDNWVNNWLEGANKYKLGFRGEASGTGLKSWGKMMTDSAAFDRCLPKRVYESVCGIESQTNGDIVGNPSNDEFYILGLAKKYKESNYNAKEVFAQVAADCLVKDNKVDEDKPASDEEE